MKKAYQIGEVWGETLAPLQDRINLHNKRFQLYGSQLYEYPKSVYLLYPVADVDSLDVRRKRMGMMPIENYLALFKIKWDLEAYKKALPDLVKALQVSGAPVE